MVDENEIIIPLKRLLETYGDDKVRTLLNSFSTLKIWMLRTF